MYQQTAVRVILVAILVVAVPAAAKTSASLTQKALRKIGSMMAGASLLLMSVSAPVSADSIGTSAGFIHTNGIPT